AARVVGDIDVDVAAGRGTLLHRAPDALVAIEVLAAPHRRAATVRRWRLDPFVLSGRVTETHPRMAFELAARLGLLRETTQRVVRHRGLLTVEVDGGRLLAADGVPARLGHLAERVGLRDHEDVEGAVVRELLARTERVDLRGD